MKTDSKRYKKKSLKKEIFSIRVKIMENENKYHGQQASHSFALLQAALPLLLDQYLLLELPRKFKEMVAILNNCQLSFLMKKFVP